MKDLPPPLRFAVIGCGMLAQTQHLPTIVQSPRTELEICCDVNEAALRLCRERFGASRVTRDYREAINDPRVQAVCLASTEKLRLPVIEAAAQAGKPIYVEKPLARSLEETYRIRDLVKQTGIAFCAGHNRRSSPAMIDAQRIFRAHMNSPRPCPWRFDREGSQRPQLPDDGVACMSVRINDDWHSWKGWVFDPQQAPHGPMLFEMSHFTDVCNWFLAAEPAAVVALEHGLFNSGVVIRYQTGELATICMGANGTFGYPKELYEAMGHGGIVVVDHLLEVRTAGIEGAPALRTYPMLQDRHPQVGLEGGVRGWLAKKRVACAEAAATGDPSRQFTAEPDKGHARAIERFAEQVQGGGAEVCGIDEAVNAMRLCFAAIRSAREKRMVDMAEI